MEKIEFCIKILKKIYGKNININKNDNEYEIILNEKKDYIETTYEIKKYMRNIMSDENPNLMNDIINIIEIRYTLSKNEVDLLNEIYPNFDVFVSAYIKNIEEKISITNFNYEKLFEYYIEQTIKDMQHLDLKKEYETMVNNKNEIEKNLSTLQNKLEKYYIAQKNSFYYETYRDYLYKEINSYNEERELIEKSIKNSENELNKSIKQYQNMEKINQLSKKTNIKRINKITEKLSYIDFLKEKIKTNKESLKKLELSNKQNIDRNNEAFKKYINMNINEYSLIYEQNKNINAKKILNEITTLKSKLNELDLKILEHIYPMYHRNIKYFCLDNLKIFKKTTDLNPKISKNIITLLENNSK